ncbi:MAG: TetR/AcrR family transcriptional regulator [Endozoicomonas sp.]
MASTILASSSEADKCKPETSNNGMELKYQGRKTSRVNSEQRRRTILEAALRIVVRDGVRGVRHRAVAKEADVPLSATTYYFKDISDLITDTFTLFVEMGAEKFKAYWEDSDSQLKAVVSQLDQSLSSKQAFAGKMAGLAVEYVLIQLREHREYLMAERAFQLECLRNDNLRPLAFNHQKFFLESLEGFFARVGSSQAKVDARIFSAVVQQVEFLGLIDSEFASEHGQLRDMLKRQIELMILAGT